MQKSLLLICSLLTVMMIGCSSKAPELADGTNAATIAQTANPELADSEIAKMAGAEMTENTTFGSVDERIAAIEKEIDPIYFPTDKYRIPEAEIYKIDKNAQVFNSELARDLSIRVEGNCDEWGTDEYNYALGLKRAKSAKDALAVAGVEEGRMSLVSYGESKPVCFEHNEACWQQNRRVDFKLLP